MDKHNVFANIEAGGVPHDDSFAKAQIARRLGLGFVIITVLLGILLLAENQFGDDGQTTAEIEKPEPPANLTINTPDNRDAAQSGLASAVATGQEVGGQITPALPISPEPIAQAEASAAPNTSLDVPLPSSQAPSSTQKAPGTRPQITRNARPVPGVVHTVPMKPVTPPTSTSAPAVAEPRKPISRLLGGNLLLQAGVFNNYQKAEELHALLTLNGIPSTLETRVQVGPFASKAEADAARAKLKTLGIESLMLPPRK